MMRITNFMKLSLLALFLCLATQAQALDAPTITNVETGLTSATITGTTVSDELIIYEVQYRKASETSENSWIKDYAYEYDPGTWVYYLEGLEPETKYVFQVRATTEEVSDWVSTTFTTQPVGVPTNIRAELINPDYLQYQISWLPGEGNDSYNIRYREVTQPQSEWTEVNDLTEPYYMELYYLYGSRTYEVQVQGVCEYNDYYGTHTHYSDWSQSTSWETEREITLAELVNDGQAYKAYSVGDLIAVYKDKQGRLYCKDDGKYNPQLGPTGDEVDYVIFCGIPKDDGSMFYEYDQSNWVRLDPDISGITFSENIIGHKLTGVVGFYRYYDDRSVNPVLLLERAPKVSADKISGWNAYHDNIYVTVNFQYTHVTLGNEETVYREFFFMPPKPEEVLTVCWAMWDGEKFVTPPTGTTNEGHIWNEGHMYAYFYALWDLYPGGYSAAMGDLQENTAYRFRAVVEQIEGTDEFRVYPISELELQGVYDDHYNTFTSVDDLQSGREVKSVIYYNMNGQASMTPFEGVNVVETRYTDGTRRMTKVIK